MVQTKGSFFGFWGFFFVHSELKEHVFVIFFQRYLKAWVCEQKESLLHSLRMDSDTKS